MRGIKNNLCEGKKTKKLSQPSPTITKKGDGSDRSDGSDSMLGGGANNNNIIYNNKKTITKGGTLSVPSQPPLPSQPSLNYEAIYSEDGNLSLIHPAVGLMNDKYYFGLMLPYIHNLNTENGTKRIKEKDRKLFLITEDGEEFEEEILSGIGYSLKDKILYQTETRWERSHILSFKQDMIFDSEPKQIFDLIREQYKNNIDFIEDEEPSILTLWSMGTYFFTLFNTYPYIHLHGLKNTGKTKVMEISSCVSFNSELSTNMRVATLFRIIQQNRPTLFIDEFEIKKEQKKSSDDKEIECILNAGYRKGITVPRMEQQGKEWVLKRFEVYCPKMIANISGMIGALPSRCIKIIMRRSKKEDPQGKTSIDPDKNIWGDIRNELYVLALKRWKDVKSIYDNLENNTNLSNRDWELWKPILSIAKFIDDKLYNKTVKFANKNVELSQVEDEMSNSWDYLLLKVLMDYVDEERFYYVKSEIYETLIKEFVEREYTDRDGNTQTIHKNSKPSSEWIGRTLRKLGVTGFKKDNKGAMYFLSKNIIMDLVTRLQLKSLIPENTNEKDSEDKIEEEMIE